MDSRPPESIMLEQVDAAMTPADVGDAQLREAIARPSIRTRGERLLFVLSTLSIGGSEWKVVKLANGLVAEGRAVSVAYLNGPDTLRDRLDPRVAVINLQRTGKFSLAALRRIAALIAERQVDTVVAINLYATLYAALLKKTASGLDHVRFLSSLNTTDFHTPKQRLQLIVYRPLLRAMDSLIFGAEYQRGLWRSKHLPRKSPPSAVLYNGVDTDFFSRSRVIPYRIEGWPSERVIIGTVGVLRPEKSHDLLIRCVAALRQKGHDVGALIVGGGAQESALRALCAELRVENYIHFCGAARDVRPYLAAMDVFVLTSTAVETFSNAALEAMAMGCPIVSSAIGGMPEMLQDGGGITYRTGDLNELIMRLDHVIAAKSTLSSLSAQAVESVRQRFSVGAMLAKFRALIECDAAERR